MEQDENLPVVVESRPVVSASDFEAAIEDGQAKAQTLKKIVEQQHLFAMISGKKYLEVEAWETIGRAYGYTAKTDWTRPVEGGGWEARAVVIDAYGVEVGAAETECGTQGDSPWDKRPSNVQRSMAQTRAVSKSLRSILSWVVVLAGYSPTPANELPDEMKNPDPENLCPVHGVEWFKKGKMKDYAHPIEQDGVTMAWCNKRDVEDRANPYAPDPEHNEEAPRSEVAALREIAEEVGVDVGVMRDKLREFCGDSPTILHTHVEQTKEWLRQQQPVAIAEPEAPEEA